MIMRILRMLRMTGVVIGIVYGRSVSAQASTAKASPARLDTVARRVVAAARYATFITVDSVGQPSARTVQPLRPDPAWRVWFATNPRTRKVREVTQQPRVALHYFDPATESYVAITGRARVVTDRRSKDTHWDPAWNAFYKNRETDAVLIVVEAARVEVVSPALGVNSDEATWRPQSFVPARRPSR